MLVLCLFCNLHDKWIEIYWMPQETNHCNLSYAGVIQVPNKPHTPPRKNILFHFGWHTRGTAHLKSAHRLLPYPTSLYLALRQGPVKSMNKCHTCKLNHLLPQLSLMHILLPTPNGMTSKSFPLTLAFSYPPGRNRAGRNSSGSPHTFGSRALAQTFTKSILGNLEIVDLAGLEASEEGR